MKKSLASGLCDTQILKEMTAVSRIPLTIVLIISFVSIFHTHAYCQETSLSIKKPAFAGTFYPSDRVTLNKMIDGFLQEVDTKGKRMSVPVYGIIAPHAGYQYSGNVASYAYAQLKGKAYSTVILMGPSHRSHFNGVALLNAGMWETPLGRIAFDHDIAKVISEQCPFIRVNPSPFAQEHSLEVQLPFLQKTLTSFKIVPLLFGSVRMNDYTILSDVLSSLLQQRSDILIVASSDMSHFHPYNKAKEIDATTLRYIERLNTETLIDNLQKGTCELCGAQAVITLMMVTKKLYGKAHVLRYANSGDVTYDKNRVVGYSAIIFYKDTNGNILTKHEQDQLIAIARTTLNEYVTKKRLPHMEIKNNKLIEKKAVFVTLTKKGQLRGCVGYIVASQPLYRAVMEMTVAASSKDRRFPPVTEEELRDIHIEISILSPLIRIYDPTMVEIGKHGLFIVKGNKSGLLLPQVATSYLWNTEEFLRQTCIKAGLLPNAWKEKETEIYIFSTHTFAEQPNK